MFEKLVLLGFPEEKSTKRTRTGVGTLRSRPDSMTL